jgi:predicted dinucleotide-binding enzyme
MTDHAKTRPLVVAVFGTGEVGRALSEGLTQRGHRVLVASRQPAPTRIADWSVGDAGAEVVTYAEAGRRAELAFVATAWDGVPLLAEANAQLTPGTTVIVATVPERPDPAEGHTLLLGHALSGAEAVQMIMPRAAVVSGFNTMHAADMVKPSYPDGQPTMFLAADSPDALAEAELVCRDLGWQDVLVAGPLRCARYLEPLGMLYARLADELGRTDIAFRLLRG